jgi:uncharacterized protein (DUF305 family)
LETTIMKIRPAVTAAITLTALLALAGCASSSGSDMDDMHHDGSSTSASAETVDANDADLMFASVMIEHHTQAVEMSGTLLSKDGIEERVIALAEDIKAAQQPEIDQLAGWLEDWDADASDMPGMDHGNGMMTDDDMQALGEATDADAARLFLEQMIVHHRGAIDMARDEVDSGQNSDAVAMAQTIIDTQTAEIATMEEILATL